MLSVETTKCIYIKQNLRCKLYVNSVYRVSGGGNAALEQLLQVGANSAVQVNVEKHSIHQIDNSYKLNHNRKIGEIMYFVCVIIMIMIVIIMILFLLLLSLLLLLLLLLIFLSSSLNTAFQWLAGVLLKHQVTATDLRCLRILVVPSKHASCNDSKRHVTPISANHFSISFETVPNAPIITGTTVTLCNFQIRFNSHFRSC